MYAEATRLRILAIRAIALPIGLFAGYVACRVVLAVVRAVTTG